MSRPFFHCFPISTTCSIICSVQTLSFLSIHPPLPPSSLLPPPPSLPLSLPSLNYSPPSPPHPFTPFPPSPPHPLTPFPPSLPSLPPCPPTPSLPQHLRSLEIDMMDMVVAERDKRTYRFTLKRADGNYTFKVHVPPLCPPYLSMCWQCYSFTYMYILVRFLPKAAYFFHGKNSCLRVYV